MLSKCSAHFSAALTRRVAYCYSFDPLFQNFINQNANKTVKKLLK